MQLTKPRISTLLLAVITPFLLSRVIIFLIIFLSSAATLDAVPAREGQTWHVSFSTFQEALQQMKMTLLSADASWYMEIAKYGYPETANLNEKAQHWVFFPAFPLLLHGLSYILPSWTLAGVFANCALFLSGIMLLYATALQITQDKIVARNAIWLVSFHPLSYFFSSPHTEALFFCTLCGAFYSLKTKHHLALRTCLALCLISRPTGLLILLGILWWMKEERYSSQELIKTGIIALIPLSLFCLHLYFLTGSPFAWVENQSAWGRAVGSLSIMERLSILASEIGIYKPWSFTALHTISLLLTFSISAILFKHNKKGWGLMLILPVLAAISTGSLLSLSRIIMPLPPIYIFLSQLTRRNEILFLSILIACSACLGVMTLLYSLHVSLAMT